MAGSNGNGTMTAAEAYDHLGERESQDADATLEALRASWMIEGDRNYPGEWNFDLSEVRDPMTGTVGKIDVCPDKIADRYVLDAKLLLAQRHKRTGRIRQASAKHVHINTATDDGKAALGKLRESFRKGTGLAYDDPRFEARLREDGYYPDPFAYGAQQAYGTRGATGVYIPLWPGPVTRQLYWQDYFAMSAKAFEAYNHDPLSWRCVHMKQEFALGKGLQARITYDAGSSKKGQRHEQAAEVWDEFWKRNKMDQRLDMFARDLSWGGEQFVRYFTRGPLTTVRTLDPASIYDIITDPEDIETVFAYHQQFQTPYQLYPPRGQTPPTGVQAPTGPTLPGAITRYIIRQIAPQEVDHYKINQSAFERRGRSDLFPALGWIKRLRDYLVSHVIRADMLSRICWDLTVKGNGAAVGAVQALLFPNGEAPPPGSIFGHNEAAKLEPLVPQMGGQSGGRWDPILDALATMVANSIGLPKDWLGMGMGTTRANALVATEPAARALEDLQGRCEEVLHDCFDRVMATAGINDAEVEFTFPSIATEDRSSKLKDLAFMESMGWASKATAGSIAAKEMGITGYEFEEEESLIADEFDQATESEDRDPKVLGPDGKPLQKPKQGDGVIRRPMVMASYRQSPKLDPTKASSSEDQPPGLLIPGDGSGGEGEPPGVAVGANTAPGASAGAEAPTRNGVPRSQNPLAAAGAKSIRQEGTAPSAARESGFTPEQVAEILVAAERMREDRARRRRPDDPEFLAAAESYREGTKRNLAQLAAAGAAGGATEKARRE